jgi:hypothetical protein
MFPAYGEQLFGFLAIKPKIGYGSNYDVKKTWHYLFQKEG